MSESDAKAAFRAMGITAPSRTLIEMWLSAARYTEQQEVEQLQAAVVPAIPASSPKEAEGARCPRAPQPGKSLLEPILRDQNALQRPPSRRKPGRPRIIASWFPAVAETMADGTTLRAALAISRLALRASEMRALYRNRTFKALYQEARRRYLLENWGRSKRPSLRSVLGSLA